MTHTGYIAYQNNGGKLHSHARCGMTRNNKVHNTPFINPEFPSADERCGKCGGGYTMADINTIADAWDAAYRQSRRSPWGAMSQEYTQEQSGKMQAAWMIKYHAEELGI